MEDSGWIRELFSSIDARDTEKFSSFLSEKCGFRFGNMPLVSGSAAISEFVAGFFDSVKSLEHEIHEIWMIPNGVVCHGMVSYTRHNDSVLTVPFCNVFKTEDGKIHEYLIFADTSQLYVQGS